MEMPPVPEKPSASTVTNNSIVISRDGNVSQIIPYRVFGRKVEEHGEDPIPCQTFDTEGTITEFQRLDLKADTPYECKVAANTSEGRGQQSETSDLISTARDPIKLTMSSISKPILDGTPTDDTVTLTWGVAAVTEGEDTSNTITNYTIMYKAVADDNATLDLGATAAKWETFETADSTFHCLVPNLKPKTAYRFCVSANTDKGRGPPSPVSDLITTNDTYDYRLELFNPDVPADSSIDSSDGNTGPPQPLKPTVAGPVGHETVPLTWKVTGDVSQITHYTLSYKKVSKKALTTIETDDAETEYTVDDLDPETTYQFKVFANTEQGQSPPSEMSDAIKTAEEPESRPISDQSDIDMVGQIYREELRDQSKCVMFDKDIPIHQVPLRLTNKDVKEKIQRFEFGTKPEFPMKEKVILVVGATGAGKSTLINGLLNYVIGVQWSEKVRFCLVEETGSFESQHKSQTKFVTVYTLYQNTAFQIPYTLTIIDTPGFGDTDGISKDKLITKSISHLFKKVEYGIDHIDAIGFVAQSSLARLTPTQRYIFDSILSVFGTDIGDNIFLLITFSDSQKPPLLASTQEAKIPYKSHFKFNNSALYASNITEDNEFDQMFWKMGALSFGKFLGELATIEGKSLHLTKQVLDEREQLEVHVTGIQEDIHNGLTKLEQYRLEIAVVRKHEADIELNKNFTYAIDEHKMVHEDLLPGQHVTNCLTCNRTCHYLCGIPNDADKKGCIAMGYDGYCEVCDGHCYWNLHRNVPYRITTVTTKVTKTSEDLQKRYQQAQGEKMNAEKLTEKILDDFYNLEIKVLYMTTEVKRGLARLCEIALRPNPLTTVQYLDILIRAEQVEARPGFEARVRQLENVKEQAKALNEMSADTYDPFDNYRETLKQAKKGGQSRPSFQTVTAEFKRKNPSSFTQFYNKVTNFLSTGKI